MAPVQKGLTHGKGSMWGTEAISDVFKGAGLVLRAHGMLSSPGFLLCTIFCPSVHFWDVGSFPGLNEEGCFSRRPWKGLLIQDGRVCLEREGWLFKA